MKHFAFVLIVAACGTTDIATGSGKGDGEWSSCAHDVTRPYASNAPDYDGGSERNYYFSFDGSCTGIDPLTDIDGDLPNGWLVSTNPAAFHGPSAALYARTTAGHLKLDTSQLEARLARTFVDTTFATLPSGGATAMTMAFEVAPGAPDDAWVAVGFRTLGQTDGTIHEAASDYLDFDSAAIEWAQVDVATLRTMVPGTTIATPDGKGTIYALSWHCGIGQCQSSDPLVNRSFILRPNARPAPTGAFAVYLKEGERPTTSGHIVVDVSYFELGISGLPACAAAGGYPLLADAVMNHEVLSSSGEVITGMTCPDASTFLKFHVPAIGFTTVFYMFGTAATRAEIVRGDGTAVVATEIAESPWSGLQVTSNDVTDGSDALYLHIDTTGSAQSGWTVTYDYGL